MVEQFVVRSINNIQPHKMYVHKYGAPAHLVFLSLFHTHKHARDFFFSQTGTR